MRESNFDPIVAAATDAIEKNYAFALTAEMILDLTREVMKLAAEVEELKKQIAEK